MHEVAMELADLSSTDAFSTELLEIKALFLQEQFRRCIEVCNEMLSKKQQQEPFQRSFVKCHSALAHDELARAMHNFSHSKVLALSDAEQLYREALRSLPTAESCFEAISAGENRADSCIEPNEVPRYPSSASIGAEDDIRESIASRIPVLESHVPHENLPNMSSPMESPDDEASEFDDVESHESYDQIMTPSRVAPKLEQDYSSMSLLEPGPPRPSHGLMRQIRVGEPPTQYYVPPRMSDYDKARTDRKLSRLQTSWSRSSLVRKQLLTHSEQASPVGSPIEPVSPLGSDSVASDASTISSLSPETPVANHQGEILDLKIQDQRSVQQLAAHIEGMRSQLETHIRLLQDAKQQTIKIQSERAVARMAPMAMTDRRIQQSHSFWSFTPVDIKAIERQRRIEAGRKRGWMRARFDPTRYRRLAEKALAEL